MSDELACCPSGSSHVPHSPKASPMINNAGDLNSVLKSSSDYQELDLIGTGAYGTVYKALDLQNPGQMVALKKVRIALTEDGIPLSTLREITLLKQLDVFQHPNIVRLLDVCHGQRCERGRQLVLFLVFEHLDQDLASYIEKAPINGIPGDKIRNMSKEILSGLDFLHSHRIVHRDLKPQNLLVNSAGHVKLADFGLAKTYDLEMKLTSVVVTLWYRPPEVLLGRAYHSAVDVWSAGAVLFELHALRPLFPGTSEADQLDKIFRVIGRPPLAEWPDNSTVVSENFPDHPARDLSEVCHRIGQSARDLLQDMLSFDPSRRPTTQECLLHPYFTEELIC